MSGHIEEPAMIYVCPLSQLKASMKQLAPSHLVSLLDPKSMIETPPALHRDRHLRLSVNDIAEPREGLVIAGETHIREILDFIDSWDQSAPMLIHCWAGISRSTATAYIALCHLNEGHEYNAALLMRTAARHAQPNRRLVALADRMMGRRGRMIEAVAEMGPGEFEMEGTLFSMPAKL
ncbi:MAG: tyrosine protein phosphatase [Alphaproteobacteria bacterium]